MVEQHLIVTAFVQGTCVLACVCILIVQNDHHATKLSTTIAYVDVPQKHFHKYGTRKIVCEFGGNSSEGLTVTAFAAFSCQPKMEWLRKFQDNCSFQVCIPEIVESCFVHVFFVCKRKLALVFE